MIESDFLALPYLHVKGHASLVWVALDGPEKFARKQLEFIQLQASKLTVCEFVELLGLVTGGFLNAIAMEEVVSAVDPTFCTGKSNPTYCYDRARAFSDRIQQLTREGRKSDADALGGSSPSVSLGGGPWAKAKHKKGRGKKSSKSRQGKQTTDSPPRSPFMQAPRNTPAK